jgi:hypothetical protein
MQAIVTTFHGPTNHRGSRIIAKCDAARRTYSWDYTLGVEANHEHAAIALATELGWLERLTIRSGALPGQSGYAHVLTR